MARTSLLTSTVELPFVVVVETSCNIWLVINVWPVAGLFHTSINGSACGSVTSVVDVDGVLLPHERNWNRAGNVRVGSGLLVLLSVGAIAGFA